MSAELNANLFNKTWAKIASLSDFALFGLSVAERSPVFPIVSQRLIHWQKEPERLMTRLLSVSIYCPKKYAALSLEPSQHSLFFFHHFFCFVFHFGRNKVSGWGKSNMKVVPFNAVLEIWGVNEKKIKFVPLYMQTLTQILALWWDGGVVLSSA